MLPKLEEIPIEELEKQLKNKQIDKEFLIEYIIKRDSVYNKLIDKMNELEQENQRYKEVIDKAITFINEENYKDETICVINGIDIVDILKEVK